MAPVVYRAVALMQLLRCPAADVAPFPPRHPRARAARRGSSCPRTCAATYSSSWASPCSRGASLAIVLGSPSLNVATRARARRAASRRACLPATLAALRHAAGHPRRRLAGARDRHGQPAHPDQLPRRARRARSATSRSSGSRSGHHAGRLRGLLPGRRRELRARRRRSTPASASTVRRRDRRRQRRPGGRLQLPRRHALPDGERRPSSQPAGGARRLSELLHAARRAGADHDGHGARPRPRRRATSSRPTAPARVSTAR